MQVTNTSTLLTQQPLQRPATQPEPPQQELSPEEQRAQTVQREDNLQAVQDNRQDRQDQTRQAAVAVVGNQQQQQNIERFVEASTGEDVDSGPSLASQIDALQNLARSARVNELATAAGNNPETVQAIRDRNAPSVPDRPENLPSIDEVV